MRKVVSTICMLIFGFLFIPNIVLAKTTEDFSLKVLDYNESNVGSGDEISDGGNLEPGKTYRVDVYFSPSDAGNIGYSFAIDYDNTVFEPIYNKGKFKTSTYSSAKNLCDNNLNQKGVWPIVVETDEDDEEYCKTNWSTQSNDTGSQITVSAADSTTDTSNPFIREGVILSFWMKVKDDVSSGANLKLDFAGGLDAPAVDKVGGGAVVNTTGVSFTANGAMSSDVSLKELTFTGNNGILYPSNPVFNSGTATRNFSLTVPNKVSSLTINAIATDEKAQVLAGGIGSKTLNIGANHFEFLVQSEDLKQEIYSVDIYRLSNDFSLSSLSFSGLTLDNALSSSLFTYSSTAPYKTASTSVSATTTNSNATIITGTGDWNLVNISPNINTKTLTVNAEDCKVEYASVPDNTCTSKDYTLNITRTAASTDNKLKELKVDNTLVSGFSSNIFEYNLGNVPYDKTSLNIAAVLNDSKGTLSGTGSQSLNVGDNTITITATSEAGVAQEYKIKVRRLSNNNKLATLSVSSTPQGVLTPNFNPTFTNYYTYTYDATVTNINITATLEDSNATIVSGLGSYDGTNDANIVVQSENGDTATYIIKFSRNKSLDATLKSLSIDGYNLNETFTPGNTKYTATVPGTIDSINIGAEANDANASVISGLGSHPLNYGINTITIRVQAETSTVTKDYEIKVTREKKNISLLTDIKIDNVSVSDFREDKLSYTVNVPFETTSINLSGILKDGDSSLSGDGNKTLNTGNNEFPLVVTAHNGVDKTTYKVNVNRAKSTNTYLSNLSLAEKAFEFNKETKTYNITVPYEVSTATITATPEYKDARSDISGPSKLGVGLNEYIVTITAEDGTTTDKYYLNITRERSTNINLSNLTVTNGTTNYITNFNSTTFEYNIIVPNDVDNVTITPTLSDPINQTLTGDTGNIILSTGLNEKSFTVTASSGANKEYKINITRSLNENNYLSALEVVGYNIHFSKENTSYTLEVESNIDNIIINATKEVDASTITGDIGTKTLATGTNTFNITIESETGVPKTYTIVVTKKASNDSSLSSLEVVGESFTEIFSSSKFNYTVNVGNSVTKVHINATASSAKAKKVVGTGECALSNIGANTCNVVVTAEDNTTSTYTITVNRAASSNAYLTNIILSNGFQITNFTKESDEEYTVNVPNNIDRITIQGVKEDNTATVTGDGEKSLVTSDNHYTITVTAQDGITKKNYKLNIIRAKSSNAYLKGLTSASGVITPDFDKTKENYTMSVPYETTSVTINAEKEDSTASVSINGGTNLVVGENTVTITVTPEDGSNPKIYTITVNRQKSSNNYLDSLEVTDKNGKNYIGSKFNKITTNYDVTVENDIDEIEIKVTHDETITVEGDGTKSLTTGSKQFIVKVISADGTPRDYIINVERKKNSNNNLSSLEVEGYTLVPDFEPSQRQYSFNVESTVDSVKINANAEKNTSTISGDTGTQNLVTGANTFTITVTSEDGVPKDYTIVITKAASNNNYLKSLEATESIAFNKETNEYNINVANSTKSFNITKAEAEADSATVTIEGDTNLTVGENTFTITVTAENNMQRIYTIKVTRAASDNNYLSDLKVNGETISGFDKEKTSGYTLDVANNIIDAVITAHTEDDTATITGDKTYSLKTNEPNVINISVVSESGITKVYTITINRAKSDNNNIYNLRIDEGILSPTFDKNTKEYSLSVPYEVTSLNLNNTNIILEDANSTFEIEGNRDFTVGSDNEVRIIVTSESGKNEQYTLKVNRLKDAKNHLTSLTVSSDKTNKTYNLEPTFDSNNLTYKVVVDEDDTSLRVDGTKESTSATATGLENISVPSFPYEHRVVVTSASGIERVYVLNIERKKSSNTTPKDITVSNGSLNFVPGTYDYTVNVDSNVDSIDIGVNLDTNQTVTGAGTKILEFGNNSFTITIVAEDGTMKNYNINVVRDDSTSSTLKNLEITGALMSPKFNKDITDYGAYLGVDTKNITITPTLSDLRSTMCISLNDEECQNITKLDIKDIDETKIGNVIKIKVTGSKETTVYKITLLKQSEEKITSTKYGHVISDGIIRTVTEKTSSEELKNQLDNDNSKLKIFKEDGITPYEGDRLATGYIIKLIENDIVLDQKTIVVIGDVDGSGVIDVIDAKLVVNHIIEEKLLTGIYKIAANTNKDDNIDAIDALKIVKHIIGDLKLGLKED